MKTLSDFINSPEGKAKLRSDWAAEIGISNGHFSDLLHSKCRPSVNLAAKIEDVTGVPMRSFADVKNRVASQPATEEAAA